MTLQDRFKDLFAQCVNPSVLINPEMLSAQLEMMFEKEIKEAYYSGIGSQFLKKPRSADEYYSTKYKTK
jgi:hypothetical protein